jgi:small subunit ribosomal protein S3Ae
MPVAETLTEKPESLIGRVAEVSLQTITNDFRKSHIKLFFKINKVEDGKALTHFDGHTLTSDYLRRMVRRRKSRIDGVYDIETRDGAFLRIKPFAITDRRIQNSQKKLIRTVMKETVLKEGKAKTLNEFLRDTIEGKIGSEIYKNCKNFYPVKRIEINKSELRRLPTIEIEDKKPAKEEPQEETKKTAEITEKKPKKQQKKTEKKEVKTTKSKASKEEKKTKAKTKKTTKAKKTKTKASLKTKKATAKKSKTKKQKKEE